MSVLPVQKLVYKCRLCGAVFNVDEATGTNGLARLVREDDDRLHYIHHCAYGAGIADLVGVLNLEEQTVTHA